MNKLFKVKQTILIAINILLINTIHSCDTQKLPDHVYRNYKNLPVLVTGGCGFIGSHLVEALVDCKARVTILDNLSSGTLDNIASVKDKINLIKGDIRDFGTCLKATANQKIVFHLAAFISVPESTLKPRDCQETNITGTQNLLEAARVNNIDRFILSSTCAVYGESTEKCSEKTKTSPTSPYGFSKLIGEMLCKTYNRVFNMQTVCLRYFNVYGTRQNPHSSYAGVIAKFMHNMEHNLPICVFGDGTQTRDYVPVHTIVQANMMSGIVNKEYVAGEIFNIATGKSISLLELIEELKKYYPEYKSETLFKPERPGDVKHVAADCSKYENLFKKI